MNNYQHNKNTQITESKKTLVIPPLRNNNQDNELRSYKTRGEKILTALYMLTDFIEAGDSLRNLLRKKGTDMLASLNQAIYVSDKRHLSLSSAYGNLEELQSYLDIAYHSRFFSEMNYSVINNEIISFAGTLFAYIQTLPEQKKHMHHVDNFESLFNRSFMQNRAQQSKPVVAPEKTEIKDTPIQQQDKNETNTTDPIIKVKDTSNKKTPTIDFKKALRSLSVKKTSEPVRKKAVRKPKNNDAKNERKETILSILGSVESASINDICDQFNDCSSKTIQRDLIELIDEQKVNKQGSRRWSTYSRA